MKNENTIFVGGVEYVPKEDVDWQLAYSEVQIEKTLWRFFKNTPYERFFKNRIAYCAEKLTKANGQKQKQSCARVSWDEYALRLAETASLRSEDPYVKVGACALDKNHRVIALGYNGLPSGITPDPEFWKDRDARREYMLHAEVNCLALVKAGEVETLACTLFPCSYCARLISAYGVKKVVYRDIYANDMSGKKFFDFSKIEVIQIQTQK